MERFFGFMLAPFFMFVLLAVFAYPVKRLIERKMPDGKLKRILLWRYS
jgi:hypothetical protein